jgi:CDGSH-type Zn-finger protein
VAKAQPEPAADPRKGTDSVPQDPVDQADAMPSAAEASVEARVEASAEADERGPSISIVPNGPYVVEGSVPLTRMSIETNENGESWEWRQRGMVDVDGTYRLCRCGSAATQPFCDDTCARIGFDGTERADRRPYLQQARRQLGPERDLTDAPRLCATARFCDAMGTIWALVDIDDKVAAELVDRAAVRCPSGRLVAWIGRDAVEADLEPSIALTSDPSRGVSGPLWVRGGIPIRSADGSTYEVRNRVTLCRCGASRNKPLCDGSHIQVRFSDRATA